MITSDVQMSSTNVTILGNLNVRELADIEQVTYNYFFHEMNYLEIMPFIF